MSRLIGVFSLFQVENIESDFTELTSHVTKTNKDLDELNNTMLRKVKKGFIVAVCFEYINICFLVKRMIPNPLFAAGRLTYRPTDRAPYQSINRSDQRTEQWLTDTFWLRNCNIKLINIARHIKKGSTSFACMSKVNKCLCLISDGEHWFCFHCVDVPLDKNERGPRRV